MTEVYIVTYGFNDEPTYTAAVYSSRESAQQLVDFMRTDDNWVGYDFYNIEEFELDSTEIK